MSYKTEAIHEENNPLMSFVYKYMKSPMGKAAIDILERVYAKDISRIIELGTFGSPGYLTLSGIETIKQYVEKSKIPREEKYIVYEFLNKFKIHLLEEMMLNERSKRDDIVYHKQRLHKYDTEIPPMDTLKRKKSNKSTPKSKRIKCTCKRK